jgi:hypothetical protein
MGDDNFSNKDEVFQAFDDIPLSHPADDTMGAILARRYGRRDILKGSLAVTAATALFGTAALQSAFGPAKAAAAGFAFRELEAGVDETRLCRRHRHSLGRPACQGHEAVRPQHSDRRGTASRAGSRSAASRPSKTRPRAGRTSSPTCRHAHPWWPSARRAAARSRPTELLGAVAPTPS